MEILKRDSNSINIASFWEGFSLGKFNFDPPYQRDSVWDEEKQSFFIDSILRNYPIPPIFLHQKIDDDTGRITFEVVDGKQRLTTIASSVTFPSSFSIIFSYAFFTRSNSKHCGV